jgi:RimJ/RimL family protein N-acetyltransferase
MDAATTPPRVTLERWAEGDLHLLERANTPEMTALLGGPEPDEDIPKRHERYLQSWIDGDAEMYRIEVDGEPAGGIGFWQTDHESTPAWETGWNVIPEFQGRGIARRALAQLLRRAAARGERGVVVAYPGVENAASNALCRSAGFTLASSGTIEWRGAAFDFNAWTLDISPLDLEGREPDVDERFDEGVLDEKLWWPYYTPHWSSRESAAAKYTVGPDGLELRIDADTALWSAEFDGGIRTSHLQTGQFSGPVGSGIGQHRFRDGLVVRQAQPERRLWLPHFGVIEARFSAVRHPDAMVAFWPIGFEAQADDCGEICIAEIFGSELDDDGGWVGVGVKTQRDPRLREDFEKVRMDGDLTQPHDYAVEWMPDQLRFFIDHRWVKTVRQRIDYPVQLMLDVYEFPRAGGTRDLDALPHRFRVERVRTFPPR